MATMSRVAFKIAFSGSVKGIPARALSTTATCNGGGPPIEDLPFPQRIRKLLGGVVDESRYNYNYWSQGGTVGREHQQAILGNEVSGNWPQITLFSMFYSLKELICCLNFKNINHFRINQ